MYQLPEVKIYSTAKTDTTKLGGLNKANNIIRIASIKEHVFMNIASQIRLKENRATEQRESRRAKR